MFLGAIAAVIARPELPNEPAGTIVGINVVDAVRLVVLWAGHTNDEIDEASFERARVVCEEMISYK